MTDWDPRATETHGYICPPCPVFYPTREQFKNPLKYISSIRHIGEQAGICKIVPPAGWRPPFAINEKTFRFRTRVQQLNCIDGHSRAEGNFVESLRMFLYRNGTPMKELPRVDGQLVNLHLLYKTVKECGGYDTVCATGLWSQVVRRVGRTLSADQPREEICHAYQLHYETNLLAYERHEQTSLRTPEVRKKTLADARSGQSTTTSSTIASTPHTKTRSSMKKQEREQVHEESQGNADDTEEDGSPASKRVKRTLFSEGGHTSSEENEPPLADIKEEAGQRKTSKTADGKEDSKVHVKKEVRVFEDAEEPVEDTIPGSLEPSALKPDPARKCRLDTPKIHAGQKFYYFLPGGAALAQVKRVFGGKKPHVAIQYVKDGSRDDIDLPTMQIIIANGWDAEAAELAYKSEICQTCLRGDCWEKMLLCDSCNGGHHLFCLDNPLDEVPPGDWYCDACVEESYSDERDTNPKFGFEMGSEYNVVAYKEKADAWKRNYFGVKSDAEAEKLTDLELEKEYWRLLSIPVHEQRLEVEYGSDVDTGSVGSGFPRMDSYLKCLRFIMKRLKNVTMNGKNDYMRKMSEYFAHGLTDATESEMSLEALLRKYAHDDWNLNNLPKLPGSVLQHLDEDIKGVMVPWIYMGMCFSTFCWHVEDHNFYSMSYNHCGAPKTWYGVPCGKADHFEETMRKLTPELFGSQPDLHLQLVTMFSPDTLIKHGVPVYRATHRPNEFMVTFPSAYHGGFNNGFNCAEAVNFATVDWIPWGAKSVRKYRDFSKLPVFSHDALICSLAETLVETSKFDYETASKFLYPAMAELYDDFVKFEEHVTAHNVTTHEWMAEFEERHHSISGSGLPVRANKKRMMSTSGDCGEKEEAAKANNFMRTTKMSMSSSSPQSKLTTRPTRMVLWAGQSGKNEGLRCVTCNQYCYLQAVVCTKCRHHSTVGCVEHYTDMCDCDSSKHYVYLHRYDGPHFKSLLQSMQSRLKQVKEWNDEYDAVFSPKQDDTMGDTTPKPTISMLKNLLSSGLKCGGADQDRLDTLEFALQDAMRWSEKAEKLVQHHHATTHEDIQLQAVLDLSAVAENLVAVPEELEQIEELLQGWHRCKRAADAILGTVTVVQQQEADSASSFNIRNPRDSESLWHESKQHQATIVSIGDLTTQIDAMGLGCQDDIVARLQHARQYLEVLVSANAVVTIIAKNMQRSRNVSRPWEHTPVQTQTPVTETACRLVVESADNLNLDSGISMFKVEMLRSFLKVTEAETAELQAALNDHSKSTEELEVVLNRLRNLAICPDQLPELSERLDKCKAWEARAKQMIDPIPGMIPNHWLRVQTPLSQQVVAMPTLEEVEAFYGQADAFFVPTTSLLRRQIHGRIQDCRRWYSAVHGLFEKSHNGESVRGLVPFLQAAIAKFHSQYKQKDHPHSRLHCVCQQVLSEKANTIACHRCHSLFHLQCVDHYPVPGSKAAAHAFVCEDCQPKYHRNVPHQQSSTSYPGSLHLRATLGSQGVPLFCLCRGGEGSSMICCDFCDEWYHSSCIDMSFEVMNQIEAYRCPRCAIKQNLYYLDKKSMRKDYLGRRPAFARVETFLTQLQSSLIALPSGALELIEYTRLVQQIQRSVQSYVQGFASEFVPETFARMNYQVEEQKLMVLMHQVTDLEVSLDGVQANLGAIHWCLRACHMVLGCEHAPKYSHLVVLLDDTKRANFTFPRVEYYHIQMTIEDRVRKASLWLKQVKTLEVEEWNIEKARRLLREYQELRQFLELPVAEVNLVHQTIANGSVDDDFVADKKRRLV